MNKNYVLVRPLQTEKTNAMLLKHHRCVFEVHPDANKTEIKKAVEELFGVTVLNVSVVSRRPIDRKRQGRVIGRTKGYKKAYVTLAEGDKIEFFEGA